MALANRDPRTVSPHPDRLLTSGRDNAGASHGIRCRTRTCCLGMNLAKPEMRALFTRACAQGQALSRSKAEDGAASLTTFWRGFSKIDCQHRISGGRSAAAGQALKKPMRFGPPYYPDRAPRYKPRLVCRTITGSFHKENGCTGQTVRHRLRPSANGMVRAVPPAPASKPKLARGTKDQGARHVSDIQIPRIAVNRHRISARNSFHVVGHECARRHSVCGKSGRVGQVGSAARQLYRLA